jgi:hypothetical protein
MTKARGEFTVESSGEDAYEALDDGVRLAHAYGRQTFTGDIEADGAVHWLMLYRPNKTARFVGLQRLSGTIGKRRGTVVLTASGEHDGKGSKISLEVAAGSGSGELAGMTGSGALVIAGKTGTYELDYRLGSRTARGR